MVSPAWLPKLHNRHASQNWREAGLDDDLRRYLMEQGIAYPFSKPEVPDAEPDIVIPAFEANHPLPIEVKVFRTNNDSSRVEIRKGFGQALHYAQEYASPLGYLVVFNACNEGRLQFGKAHKDVPSFVSQNRTIYCIPIQVVSLGSPSKSTTPGWRTINFEETFMLGANPS